ncbi:hypothetical protein ACIQ8G_01995 [Streptomyces sp. NPDC094154]|uniref:hypothetical protein n=1 Tax=Streptomyces sp. NPDC094154 TaxID=3366059 RepID=UPI003814A361
MEQRIGSSSQPLKAEPVKGAGFDPAHIPGLTAPATAEPEDARPPQSGQPPAAETVAEDAGTAGEAERPEEKHPEERPEEKSPEERPEERREEVVDGPVFEAADRRARIVADHNGVRLCLDDQECEFRWDEIGAVETETARFGKLFTITVHTPERRWYPIEIEAPSRASFTEWETRLDAVLDAYFEDGAASEDDTAEDTAVKETAARDEAAKDDADKDTAAGKDTADEPSADDA